MSKKWTETATGQALWETTKPIVVSRGGTRSGKTHGQLKNFIKWLFTGEIRQGQYLEAGLVSIVRESLPVLRRSAERDFIEILKNNDLYHLVKHNKSTHEFIVGRRKIEFFSADNGQKLRGGTRDVLFCNEGNELSYSDFWQLNTRTNIFSIIDFNPDDPDIWIRRKLEEERAKLEGDVEVIVSNYKWNGWLPEKVIKEIELTRTTAPDYWEVYGKGNYGKIAGLVFQDYVVIAPGEFPEGLQTSIGIDFGYVDPTAVVEVAKDGQNLYIRELFYDSYHTTKQVAKKIKGQYPNLSGVAYSDHGKHQEWRNSCIEVELNLATNKARKGPNSIDAGIKVLQNHRLHITSDSSNLLKEIRKYKNLTDSKGNPIEGKYIPFDDHTIDALRYAVYSHWYRGDRKIRTTRT